MTTSDGQHKPTIRTKKTWNAGMKSWNAVISVSEPFALVNRIIHRAVHPIWAAANGVIRANRCSTKESRSAAHPYATEGRAQSTTRDPGRGAVDTAAAIGDDSALT